VPNWEGEFRDFQDWANFAHKRLTVAYDSAGQKLPAICVDTLGRRCHNGRDMMRARDEGAFPVRYFFECREGQGVIAALQAVEAAMMRKPDGSLAEAGWNIAALTRARPAIHAALREAGAQRPVPGARPQPDPDVMVPGLLHCAKCGFRLNKVVLNVSDGNAYADTDPDTCPNCNVPMWRVSWKDEAQHAYKVCESQVRRALKAEHPSPIFASVRQWTHI
jgi:hypothetical protein